MESTILETLADADFSNIELPVFTIYYSPADFPGKFVVRVWDGRTMKPSAFCSVHASLEEARADVPDGMHRMSRTAEDDPVIVESYL